MDMYLNRWKERPAEMFYQKLRNRLWKFKLELAEEKSRIVSSSRFRKYEKTSFSFLGIVFRWGVSNNGKDIIKRRTERKRLQRAFTERNGVVRTGINEFGSKPK